MLLSNCAASIHSLRMLRSHRLRPLKLQEVARMTTISFILYASTAWRGFTSFHDRDRLERLVGWLRRGLSSWGCPHICTNGGGCRKRLFRAIVLVSVSIFLRLCVCLSVIVFLCSAASFVCVCRRVRIHFYYTSHCLSLSVWVSASVSESSAVNNCHVLHHSIPRAKTAGYNLRPRVHNFKLVWKDTRNFLTLTFIVLKRLTHSLKAIFPLLLLSTVSRLLHRPN